MQKIPKNSKILKNDSHFQIPHPQFSLKQFSNMRKCIFFYCVEGRENDKGFLQKKIFFKK